MSIDEIVVQRLDAEQARSLTDEVKADAAALWAKLLDLYNGDAHLALGYSSWASYYEAEFGGGRSRSYQLLEAARVVGDLEPVQHVGLPANDRVARELLPLEADPRAMREAWSEAVAEYGPQATAIQVREHVKRNMDVHYSSATDDWATPQDFFDVVDAEFGFELDVCALPGVGQMRALLHPGG